MTPKQKAIELLSQMPEPYKTWALENFDKCCFQIEKEIDNIADAVFILLRNNEPKNTYLINEIANHYRFGTHLPELPIEYKFEKLQKENDELKQKLNKLQVHSSIKT